jgi:hypothetical protein
LNHLPRPKVEAGEFHDAVEEGSEAEAKGSGGGKDKVGGGAAADEVEVEVEGNGGSRRLHVSPSQMEIPNNYVTTS